jgi:hypothetical protein
MDYKMMVPPNEIINFSELRKKQVDEHFNWYVSQIPFRIRQLENYVNSELGENLEFDFSKKSLIYIWQWFEKYIKTEKKTENEMNEELIKYPQWLHSTILEEDYKFTLDSIILDMDLAIYFAETIINNNPTIKWGYITKPKNRMSVNKPVLLGFKGGQDLDPRNIILNCMYSTIENKDSQMLFNLYNIWIDKI